MFSVVCSEAELVVRSCLHSRTCTGLQACDSQHGGCRQRVSTVPADQVMLQLVRLDIETYPMPIRHGSPSHSVASGTSMQLPLTYMRATARDTSCSVRFARSLSPSGRRMNTFRRTTPPSPAPHVGNRSPWIRWKTMRHVQVANCQWIVVWHC